MAALFDRDYRSSAEIDDFLENTDFDGVCCRVLGRKEIENYALCPESVSRLIIKEAKRRKVELSTQDVLEILFKVTNEFEVDTASNRNGHRTTFARKNGSSSSDTSLSKAEMLEFKDLWSTLEGRFKIIGGKSFVGDLSRYLQENFGFSISLHRLIDEMQVDEIDDELLEILASFDETLLS